MDAKTYNNLPDACRSARDAEITAALTTEPQWVEEWEEWVALDDNGYRVWGETSSKCEKSRVEMNEWIANWNRNRMAWGLVL